jgi:hypothetical protein
VKKLYHYTRKVMLWLADRNLIDRLLIMRLLYSYVERYKELPDWLNA